MTDFVLEWFEAITWRQLTLALKKGTCADNYARLKRVVRNIDYKSERSARSIAKIQFRRMIDMANT